MRIIESCKTKSIFEVPPHPPLFWLEFLAAILRKSYAGQIEGVSIFFFFVSFFSIANTIIPTSKNSHFKAKPNWCAFPQFCRKTTPFICSCIGENDAFNIIWTTRICTWRTESFYSDMNKCLIINEKRYKYKRKVKLQNSCKNWYNFCE